MAGDWRSKIHSPVNDVMSVQTPIKTKTLLRTRTHGSFVTAQSAVKLKRALNVLSPDVCSIFLFRVVGQICVAAVPSDIGGVFNFIAGGCAHKSTNQRAPPQTDTNSIHGVV